MIVVDSNYIMDNLNKLREAIKTSKVQARDLSEQDFIKGVFKLMTLEGSYSITIEDFYRAKASGLNYILIANLVESSKGFYKSLVYNKKEDLVHVDAYLVCKRDLYELGYELLHDNIYAKSSKTVVKFFELEESVKLKVKWLDVLLEGEKGDYLVIHNLEKNDVGIVNSEVFRRSYSMLN